MGRIIGVLMLGLVLLGMDVSWWAEEVQAGQITSHKARPGQGKHGRPSAADPNLTLDKLSRGVVLGDICLEDPILSNAGLTVPSGCYDLLLYVLTDIAATDFRGTQARIQFVGRDTGQIAADFDAIKGEPVLDAPDFPGIHIETTMVTELRSMTDATWPESLGGPSSSQRIQSLEMPMLTCIESCQGMRQVRCHGTQYDVERFEKYRRPGILR